ncbi:MAG: glutaredoxin family protein [Meiothermus sp.]|uniref:glutaredoxin family protein n=1 Tax=Meiothermus sp. TaxID=1955249 RepID=UPI0025CC470F|nr:glutaredoxin family protein [Meiothermus sp.]MCS7057485.1 glutaredoxin family protein [Meiothermus sp.]MCS7195631.1 glutaredoxin family protein [Meiothermus sp.]MCX7739756.1 glutaredoxin family protein [Meiothermus sp.]MDW8091825.1 glutaredoxin family protein [Meiothermus sp.]MDW8480912.1 glutaredoxin family protein [Meiothermus sp.]
MIVMYTTAWCPDCRAAKQALLELGLPFTEVDIEQKPEAAELVMRLNGGKRSVPTLVYGPHAVSLSRFSPAKLKGWLEQVGLRPQMPT